MLAFEVNVRPIKMMRTALFNYKNEHRLPIIVYKSDPHVTAVIINNPTLKNSVNKTLNAGTKVKTLFKKSI